MHIRKFNRKLFALDDLHPAKKFLTAFIRCRRNCVGRHHTFDGQESIDQEWISSTDRKTWRFSEFAYKVLAFDVELDGYINDAPTLTESELQVLQQLPRLRCLMHECADAATRDGNTKIVELTQQVLELLDRWEECTRARERSIDTSDKAT